MSLRLYNTLSRKKEEFKSRVQGRVSMYVCGPTVYNYISIGNSRPIIVFNMVRNYFKYAGYKVNFVQNITDIEDKIINRANEENVDYEVITKRYIKAFTEDLEKLDIDGFDSMPLATEMIGEIINVISRILENGYGYEIDGNVYFDVAKFKDYASSNWKSFPYPERLLQIVLFHSHDGEIPGLSPRHEYQYCCPVYLQT